MQTDVGGASFKQIAQEMGYASESGAKQAVEKAMTKVQFASSMDPDQLQIVVLTAMSDYIDFLNKSGELTPADVQLMKDHPNIVSELDGFREFLDKYMKRQMKGKGVAEAMTPGLAASTRPRRVVPSPRAEVPAQKTGSRPKCEECGRSLTATDKKAYELEGGSGYPAVCEYCAEKV